MARGQKDPNDPDDGPILSPEELDISENEHVAEIDDGRYVVSPNGPIGDVGETDDTPESSESDGGAASERRDTGPEPEQPAERVEIDERAVREWLKSDFQNSSSRYGFDVTGKFDGSIQHRRMVSNDVVTIFESLMLWYAQQIDSTTPVEEVLGILLTEANVPIRLPPASLKQVLQQSDLQPDDSIAEFIEAIDDDGFRL